MLIEIFTTRQQPNLDLCQRRTIVELKKLGDKIVIKPADKNLGIVILDCNTYIDQCLQHLSSPSYKIEKGIPSILKQSLQNIIIEFKREIHTFSPTLYQFLIPAQKHRPPRFYGLPKIHKLSDSVHTPPLRPIVSHTNSLLSYSAQFIEHVLQPLARSYPDYLQNSTQLINTLSEFQVHESVTLVSMDVINLFPSIPQEECLAVIFDEMKKHQHLLLFDPNLIIKLLAINMRNNYFEFGGHTFHQTTGIAMGASFSPTVANIYMSTLFQKFSVTQKETPLLLKRYIDDIFIIWPENANFAQYYQSLNSYHTNIKFTTTISTTSVNYLDLTIYKGKQLALQNLLDIKTFQKENNLYQYLHFTSYHQKAIFKAIITGECSRYIRSNTDEANYQQQVQLLNMRLQRRGYPVEFIEKYTRKVQYSTRITLLKASRHISVTNPRPIFKCLFPPQFKHLKEITLREIHTIKKYINKPIFAILRGRNLQNVLVRAKHDSDPQESSVILQRCTQQSNSSPLWTIKHATSPTPRKCGQRICITCQHYNTNNYFRSTKTRQCLELKEILHATLLTSYT